MDSACCPRCGGASVLTADLLAVGDGGSCCVRPRNCRPSYGSGLGVRSTFAACASCGLVWSAVDPDALREFIRRNGEEIARQQLDAFDRGPFRDLPDTDVAREIGAAVAEVDALCCAGSTAVPRRYRELRGVPWDQALRETRNWPRLTREEKLKLFGWAPKKKAVLDDFDSPFP